MYQTIARFLEASFNDWFLSRTNEISLVCFVFLNIAVARYFLTKGTQSKARPRIKDLKLPGPKPNWLMGNVGEMGKKTLLEIFQRWQRESGNTLVYYEGRRPILLFYDKECIKELMVKQGTEFCNRREMRLRGFMKHSILDLTDNDWRRVRHTLSPIFSAKKMKQMFPLVMQSAEHLVEHLNKLCEQEQDVELKNESSSYTLESICSTGFGLDINNFEHPDNIVYKNAKRAMEIDLKNPFMMSIFFFPCLAPVFEWFGVEVTFINEGTKFIRKFVTDAVKEREQSGIKRPDSVQFMVEAKQLYAQEQQQMASGQRTHGDHRKGLNQDEISAQLVLFLLAGYETTANATSFMLFLLANHPDCQDQARKEVDDLYNKHGELTYDSLSELQYLTMCMNETLRLYSPAFMVDRRCSQDMEVCGMLIPANTVCTIPCIAIHRDPELWDLPDHFLPDRHTKHIDQYQFFPFGLGPRNCVGMRLALIMVKVAVAKILRNFRLVPCDKTKPVELEPSFQLKAKDGLWVKLEKRQHETN